eukprot:IDg16867t1
MTILKSPKCLFRLEDNKASMWFHALALFPYEILRTLDSPATFILILRSMQVEENQQSLLFFVIQTPFLGIFCYRYCRRAFALLSRFASMPSQQQPFLAYFSTRHRQSYAFHHGKYGLSALKVLLLNS